MCCYIDKKYTERFLAKAKRDGVKFIWGFKKLNAKGKSAVTKFRYRAGKHSLRRKNNIERYVDYGIHSGFHFYTKIPKCWTKKYGHNNHYLVIKIKVNVDDIIGISGPEDGTRSHREAVANSIFISKSEWAKFKKNLKLYWKNV